MQTSALILFQINIFNKASEIMSPDNFSVDIWKFEFNLGIFWRTSLPDKIMIIMVIFYPNINWNSQIVLNQVTLQSSSTEFFKIFPN